MEVFYQPDHPASHIYILTLKYLYAQLLIEKSNIVDVNKQTVGHVCLPFWTLTGERHGMTQRRQLITIGVARRVARPPTPRMRLYLSLH